MLGDTHHRNSSSTFTDTVIGNLSLSTTPAEVKAGASILSGRKRIYIINDSSNLIYLFNSAVFTPGVTPAFVCYSGTIVTIDVEPNPADKLPERFWLATDEVAASVKIMEVK